MPLSESSQSQSLQVDLCPLIFSLFSLSLSLSFSACPPVDCSFCSSSFSVTRDSTWKWLLGWPFLSSEQCVPFYLSRGASTRWKQVTLPVAQVWLNSHTLRGAHFFSPSLLQLFFLLFIVLPLSLPVVDTPVERERVLCIRSHLTLDSWPSVSVISIVPEHNDEVNWREEGSRSSSWVVTMSDSWCRRCQWRRQRKRERERKREKERERRAIAVEGEKSWGSERIVRAIEIKEHTRERRKKRWNELRVRERDREKERWGTRDTEREREKEARKEMSFIEIDYLNSEETIANDCEWTKFSLVKE